MAVVDEPVASVVPAALECRRHPFEAARITESPRRRSNENDSGIEMRQPDDGRSIRSQIRIDRETGSPLQEQRLKKLGLVNGVGRCRPIVALARRRPFSQLSSSTPATWRPLPAPVPSPRNQPRRKRTASPDLPVMFRPARQAAD
jgi:hypothetical protein